MADTKDKAKIGGVMFLILLVGSHGGMQIDKAKAGFI